MRWEVDSLPSGIIVKGIGGFYYVSTSEGVYECKARGVFRKKNITPLPGDKVSFSIIDDEKKVGSIDNIMPRVSELVRPAVANIDQVVAVIAVKTPEPDLLLLDKLLVTVEQKKLDPVICINKIDLDTEEEYKKLLDAYSKTGYKIILTSFKDGRGYKELKDALYGRITVFAGQSGVGKSTILNKIINSNVMETGEVSEKIQRGRHTTRHAELIKLYSDGYVVDTPGFSSLEIKDIPPEELQFYYPEFSKYLDSCKFSSCRHISEPQCAVKKALEEGLIDEGRYERYIQLYNILKINSEKRYKK